MAAQSNVAECCRVDTPIACLSNTISNTDSDHCAAMSLIAESARGISPRAAHRSGHESLDSSGSCHRMKAAAFR
jgi:hypothetical protein